MRFSEFGEFIAEKREEQKLSLRKMAKALEISPAYWSDIEKGRRNPPNLQRLEEIAQLLHLGETDKDRMVDLASQERDEIPMDLQAYIKNSDLAKIALRKAKNMASNAVTEQAWLNFIQTLEDDEDQE